MRGQKGFTLIELVVVIVVLGILAAVAVPRFVDLQSDARVATVRGLEGSVRGAAALAHAKALADTTVDENAASGESITMEGQSVDLVYGYPAAAAGGMDNALDLSGFSVSVDAGPPAALDFTKDNAPTPANCEINYQAPTAAGGSPTITIDTSGC